MNIIKKINNIHLFKRMSIRNKILLYLIIFSIFIISLLWISQSLLSFYLYRKYQIRDIQNIAKEIRQLDEDDLESYLKSVVYENSICVEYVKKDGTSILYNDYSVGCLLGKVRRDLDITEYKLTLREEGEVTSGVELVNPDYKSSALLYGVEVDHGYVFIFTMLRDINKNNKVIQEQLIYLTIITIIVAIFISYLLARKFSKPIMNITKKSKDVANGNYDVVFDKSDILEIDELADSLNYLETEVSKTDEFRRDLMANVSHDLKTPLTMIRAYAEMVRDITYKDKEKRDENLNVIIDEADRLNVLVGNILTLSKLQSNVEILNQETFNLRDEIDSIVNKYSIIKELEGYTINVDCPKNVSIYADKEKINSVIYNLINNALNYTGNDKQIWVNVKEEKKNYLVEIVDSGKGIDEKDLKNIWDKYYKKEKNHKRNIVGTGLGLSIVKNVLEMHKCEYGVISKKNQGSTFWFKIKKNKKH